MLTRLRYLWEYLRALWWAVVMPLSGAHKLLPRGRVVLWVVHGLLVVAVLVGLYHLNKYFQLVEPPFVRAGEFLRNYYVPVFAFACYLLAWVGWWLWKLLGSEEGPSPYPEIDKAWEEAVAALRRADISLHDTPLFLVLGEPRSGEGFLFAASGQELDVAGAPPWDTAPVRAYGKRNDKGGRRGDKGGIYVTCPGASLSGRLAYLMAREARPAAGGEGEPDDDPEKTIKPGKRVQQAVKKAQQGGVLSEADRQVLLGPQPRAAALRRNGEEVQGLTGRLRHLCRLIVRDRRPLCPVNGILLLIPFAATDHDGDADDSGALLQKDLAAAREEFRLHCPLLALVCDLERAPGFDKFLEQCGREERRRRLGQRFPLAPDLPAGQLPGMVDAGVRWLCHAEFPERARELFRLESPGRDDLPEALEHNARLYWLMSHMHERQSRLSRVLTQAALPADNADPEWAGHPPLFGGCYLGATGAKADDQAFVAGVFSRLIEDQGKVAWTRQAKHDDERHRRWAWWLKTALGAALALALLALFFVPW